MELQSYKLQGTLIYEPQRPNLKKTFKAKTLIVQLPFDDLANLYRWFVKQKYGFHLLPPMWGTHVTVVRGDEKLPKPEAWKKYAGESVDIEVVPHLYKVWDFWAMPVRSQRLYELRDELGLEVFHEMHLTIGRETDHDRKLWTLRQLKFLSERPMPEATTPKPIEVRNGRKVLTLKGTP